MRGEYLLAFFATVFALPAQSQTLDDLTDNGCQVRASYEGFFPGDIDDQFRIRVPYLVMQCADGTIHACTVTLQKTLDQSREVGLISNRCLPVTSRGNL